MDPKAMKNMADMQAKMAELAQKSQDVQQKADLQKLSESMKYMMEMLKLQNNREERASRERIEGAKLAQERMQLAEGALIHPMATPVAQQFAQIWPPAMAFNPPGRIL
jgi:hypothetical protein